MKLAPIFKDGMVLQRDKRNRIWGSAGPDEMVTIEFLGKSYQASSKDGRWYADLDATEAGGPYEMIVYGTNTDESAGVKKGGAVYALVSGRRLVIKDILVGEVWFAGGQSNMELELQNSENGIAVLHAADYDRIRFYNVPKYPCLDEGLNEAEAKTCWRYARGEECKEMSAVAFYFAVTLHQTLDVPVGIIDCYIGGTSITCWIPKEDTEGVVDGADELRAYLGDWDNDIRNTPPKQYERELAAYNKEVDGWNQRVDELKKENPDILMEEINEKAGLYPWPPPRGGASQYRPFGLYESMVSRVKPYGIRGFIYYQGEEDQDRPDSYSLLNKRLIHRWREDFSTEGFEEFPFIITQLPMFVEKGLENVKKFVHIREQQAAVADSERAVGMAVLTDCGEYDNIHPTDKKTPGERLALQALGRVYDRPVKYENMQVDKVVYEGSSAFISFRYTYNGIHIRRSSDGELTAKLKDSEVPVSEAVYKSDILGFELSGDGKNFVPAKAYMEGDVLCLSADGIDEVKAVRYAYFDYGVANIYNAAGLPLRMFEDSQEIGGYHGLEKDL